MRIIYVGTRAIDWVQAKLAQLITATELYERVPC
jgi:hypothetical protein